MKRVYIDESGMVFEGDTAELIIELEDLAKERESKNSEGGNIMNRLFKKTGKTKVVEIDKRDGKIKRKAKVIRDIAVGSIKGTASNPLTYVAGGTVGLQNGLKYKGDFEQGCKAGVATVAVLVGIDVAANIINNMDVIKEA